MTETLTYDVSHVLAGGMLFISFMLLYQDRMYGLLNVFALRAFVLSLSVAWEAFVQEAPHLYITAVHCSCRKSHHHPHGPAPNCPASRDSPDGRNGGRYRRHHAGRHRSGCIVHGADVTR